MLFTSDDVSEYDADMKKRYDEMMKLSIDNVVSVETGKHETLVTYNDAQGKKHVLKVRK